MQTNFIEITLRHGCSLVNLQHILRTSFPKNSCGGLLLNWKLNNSVYKDLKFKNWEFNNNLIALIIIKATES